MEKQQHEKINGYRKLDDSAIKLMNKLKGIESDFKEALQEVEHYQRDIMQTYPVGEPDFIINGITKKDMKETYRNTAKAFSHIEDACMRGVRAIALPK